MRSFSYVCPLMPIRVVINSCLCSVLILFFVLSSPVFAWNYPLTSSDARVVEGNAIFEDASRKLEKELDIITERFARKLRPDIQVIFDDSQMDWIVYLETEKVAFKPTNEWTVGVSSSDKYENLYQQNVLFALNFRIGQVSGFLNNTDTAPHYTEAQNKALLLEIEEAQYRINVWTEERLRYRLYRAEKAWETYRASVKRFAEVVGWDQTRILKLDFLLLEYRFNLLSRQREALFRLKVETQECVGARINAEFVICNS